MNDCFGLRAPVTARSGIVVLAAAALMAIVPSGSDSRPLEKHFGPQNSCYQRVYSQDHLSSHPTQRVSQIRIDHFPRTYGMENENGDIRFDPVTAELYFVVSVKFRNSNRVFRDGGFCTPGGQRYRCQIECDGGSFYLKDRDADSILLINDRGFRISGCSEQGYRILDPEPDDAVFRLDRSPDLACRPPGQETGISKHVVGISNRQRTDPDPEPDVEPANDDGWTMYENGFSGWRVEYPSNLLHEQPANDNAAVAVFRSSNEEVEMIAYGTINDFDSLSEFRDQTLQYGEESSRYGEVAYAPMGNDWFVLSGYRGNRIYYDKYVFSEDRSQVQAVLIEYPEYYRAIYDDVTERIAGSFAFQELPVDPDEEETAAAPRIEPSGSQPVPAQPPAVAGGAGEDWGMYAVNPGDYFSPPGLPDVLMKPTCTGNWNTWNFLFTHQRGDLRATLDFNSV